MRTHVCFLYLFQMEDVQWYDRSELLSAVQLYEENKEETMQSRREQAHTVFYVHAVSS
jgi:hypothetical protein